MLMPVLFILSQINKKQRETVKNAVGNYEEGSRLRYCSHPFTTSNCRGRKSSLAVEGFSSIVRDISSTEMDLMILFPNPSLFTNYYFSNSFVLASNCKKIIVEFHCWHLIYVFKNVERVSAPLKDFILKKCCFHLNDSVKSKDTLIIIKEIFRNLFLISSGVDLKYRETVSAIFERWTCFPWRWCNNDTSQYMFKADPSQVRVHLSTEPSWVPESDRDCYAKTFHY